MRRECGDCQLCCRLLPMHDNEPWRKGEPIDKPAGVRCPHQKHRKGCAIYANRPFCCQMWSCRWLVNDDAADLGRPDHSHYVIDISPDYITLARPDGESQNLQVVQIWIDPKYPLAHRDPALRKYLERRAKDGIAGLVRFNSKDGLVIFPPALAEDGQWHEVTSGMESVKSHSARDVANALGGEIRIVLSAED